MQHAAHQKGRIVANRTARKDRLIGEVARTDRDGLQRRHVPYGAPQLQPLKTTGIPCDRVSERAGLKKSRGLVERSKYRRRRHAIGRPRVDCHRHGAVVAIERHAQLLGAFGNFEPAMMVHAGKDAPARQGVQTRIGVASSHEHPLLRHASVVPLHGGAMGGVLRRNAQPRRQPARANPLQANQANAGQANAAHQLGPERRRQRAREHVGVNLVIHQNAAIDHARDDGELHDTTSLLGQQRCQEPFLVRNAVVTAEAVRGLTVPGAASHQQHAAHRPKPVSPTAGD